MKNIFLMAMCFCCSFAWLAAQTTAVPSLEAYLQNNHLATQSTGDGLHYMLREAGQGASPTDGQFALINFKAMLLDSTVFDQSQPNEPFIFQLGNREVIKGLDKAVRLLKKGASAVFFLPPSLGYMHYGVKDRVPPNSPLIYEVELLDVLDFEQYDLYMRQLEERERVAFEQQEKAQFQKDLQLIAEYAAAQQLKTQRTQAGVSYAISKAGKGPNAKPGNLLTVNYEGFLLDGTPFEKSGEGKPFEFVLGQGKAMEGWEDGLRFFNKGSEGWLLIPSKLAYGPLAIQEGSISIPANAVLVFKIKVMDVK
jgi:FKBP-type peptidyl-prolyl cis-trans isomerase